MSRIVKCICDGCGKEIEKDPIRVHAEHVDAETGDFITDDGGNYYWENRKDYCENCATQIIQFIDGLPARNAGKPAVPNPEFEKAVSEMIQASEKPAKKNKPTIAELLEAGKSVEEIVAITGCSANSVLTIRSKLRKESASVQEDKPIGIDQSNSNKKWQRYQPEGKTVKCNEVMKTCAYAGKTGAQLTCDYAIEVGHSRGCDPEACTCYKKKVGK